MRIKQFLLEVVVFTLITCWNVYQGFAYPYPASPVQGHAPVNNNESPQIIEGPKDEYFAKNLPATLNCLATGVPAPAVTWYQNGKKLQFDSETSYNDHYRMMLPTGELFFLRFTHSRNQTHVGTYYCKATNILGSDISKEASVKIAVIKEDFRQEPVDTIRAIHSTVTLHCKPPRGEPEPEVFWQHNERRVLFDDRISQHGDGDLTISTLTAEDSGEYVCFAKNKAGVRQSSPALLTVLEVPEITGYPEDVSTDEGSTVEFLCEVSGNAEVKWRMDGVAVNREKWLLLPDHTLRIENVEADDEGMYVCIAENAAGAVEAVAHLKIEYTPKFLIRPQDQSVAVGRTISLYCTAEGNPQPTIYWETKAQEELMFLKYMSGRFSVSEDGTLRIEHIQKSDQGMYSCIAYSSKGKAQTSAMISVRDNDFRPPPIIWFGPENLTLAEDTVALLRCQATGDPSPVIRWFRNGQTLEKADARYLILDSGTLQISGVRVSDSGSYMCKAASETGETTWTSTLIVEPEGSIVKLDKAPPDLTMYPGAPEKPTVSEITDTSVRLTWQQLRDTGASPISSYQVELYGYGLTESWKVIEEQYTKSDVTVEGLLPNTMYVFIVRAVNSHGKGGPSPLSDIIRTLEKGHGVAPTVTLPVDQVVERLQDIQVSLLRGEAVNSSAVRVHWKVNTENEVVTGYVIQYRHILNMGDRQDHRYGQSVIKHIPWRPLSHTITGLESYEYYEICIMAASGEHTTPCSKPMKIQSGEAVPTRPPKNVILQRISESEIHVKWSPPDKEYRKGEIIGYQVKCFSEDGLHNCSFGTNGSTNEVKVAGLVQGLNYHIKIAAQTEKGVGKFSAAFSVGPADNQITKKAWFIGMIGALGGILWLCLCVFTVWLCKSRKRRKKLKEHWYTGGPTPGSKAFDRNGSVTRKGYNMKERSFNDSKDSSLPPEHNTLLQQSKPDGSDCPLNTMPSMVHENIQPDVKAFYDHSCPVTPYATTALLQAQNSRKKPDEVSTSCLQHSGGSADLVTDRSITKDENGMLVKHHHKCGYGPGISQNQPVIHWNDVLPPPPSHLPCDGEYVQDDQLYSEIPDDQSTCPHHFQMQKFNKEAYSDTCNHCLSLREFENRPYYRPSYMSRAHGTLTRSGNQRDGTPIYLHGYSQPWDFKPLPGGAYDYAEVPNEDNCRYTQPIQDGLTDPCINPEHFSSSLTHPQRNFSDSPRRPSGNYCEASCRGQFNNLNKFRTRGEEPQYLDSYKLESQLPNCSEYRVCNSGDSQTGSSVESVKSKGCLRHTALEGMDVKQINVGAEMKCRPLMYRTRAESSGQCMLDEGYLRNADSPISEDPDYAENSENDVGKNDERDSMVANWESQEDCSDLHSSSSNVSDEGDNQFLNEEDFASAVARAAELSGLTVVGTTVCDSNPKHGKKRKPPARPVSPDYSTDSTYDTADTPHKPYPKSQRRKQLPEYGKTRKKQDYSSSKGDTANVLEMNPGIEFPNNSVSTKRDESLSSNPTRSGNPELDSLYRNSKAKERITREEGQRNSEKEKGVPYFGDDIPVV